MIIHTCMKDNINVMNTYICLNVLLLLFIHFLCTLRSSKVNSFAKLRPKIFNFSDLFVWLKSKPNVLYIKNEKNRSV